MTTRLISIGPQLCLTKEIMTSQPVVVRSKYLQEIDIDSGKFHNWEFLSKLSHGRFGIFTQLAPCCGEIDHHLHHTLLSSQEQIKKDYNIRLPSNGRRPCGMYLVKGYIRGWLTRVDLLHILCSDPSRPLI